MKKKKVKIDLKDIKTALNEFVETGEAIMQGKHVEKETGLYFTSLKAFKKALTLKRLEQNRSAESNDLFLS